jgi:hypothetical protein
MIGASLVRASWMAPPMTMPSGGPPWELPVHVSATVVIIALWLAAIVGLGGVLAGLAAVRRGARPRARTVLVAALIAVAAFMVLPPAGSTDALDYAAYGRLLVLGHTPYVIPPIFLRLTHDALSRSVPLNWDHQVSVYGPLATVEQFLAAKLGGTSAARIVFWLKLWNAIAFGAVAVAADRLLRADPARRIRAHLLWTLNPLLLWALIAAGHLDVLAAAAGMLGLLLLGKRSAAGSFPWPRVLAAGALTAVAADIKISYILFGLGIAWVLRRSPAALLAAACSTLAVLAPSYAWFGPPAIKALLVRAGNSTLDNFYQLIYRHLVFRQDALAIVAIILVAAMSLLTLARLPEGVPEHPAIRPALALSAAWLFIWPYQMPWYDAMIICLLVLYPASRLDWVVLARLTAGTIALMPGTPAPLPGYLLTRINHDSQVYLAPIVLLAAVIWLAALCVTGRWKLRLPVTVPGPVIAPAAPTAGAMTR